jgi:hypothetical protein
MCNVTDNVAVDTVQIIIVTPDGSTLQMDMSYISPFFYYYTATYTIPGTYTYYMWANDTAGNIQTTPLQSFQMVDSQPPQVELFYPLGGEYLRGVVDIIWTAVDASDPNLDGDITIKYSNDNGTSYVLLASNQENDGIYTFDSTLLPDGMMYKILINATDSSNNTGADLSPVPFTIDNTPPQTTCTLVGPKGNNGWYTDTVTVFLDAQDNTSGVSSLRYQINGGNWTEYTGSFIMQNEGNYTLRYYATDIAGNQEPQNITFVKIDWTNPLVTITKPTNGVLYILDREIISIPNEAPLIIGSITITVESPNETSGIQMVEFSVDYMLQENVSEEPWEWTWDESVLFPRRYLILVKIYDWAGNTNLDTLLVRKWL